MGNRLSKIYTKTGDQGTTGLGDGSRCPKDALRIEAIGDVDELNSWIGLLAAQIAEETPADPLHHHLSDIQQQLFDLGGELSIPDYQMITAEQVETLETLLDRLNADLPALKDFILPGGNRTAAYCHLARSVCRRAERRLVSLHRESNVSDPARAYLNRLSDLLFVMARVLARRNGGQEVLWKQRASKS